jgi:Cu-Zn family superoxide dismutase
MTEYNNLKYKIKYFKLKNEIKKQQGGGIISAIACFKPINHSEFKIEGTVKFIEDGNLVKIQIKLSGLTHNHKHGFHVHEAGDLTDHCTSACAHFNPYNKKHGCPGSGKERHVGDLGNLVTDSNGNVDIEMTDDVIKLRNDANIIGRTLIIHRDPDDCGNGTNDKSLINGNAGDRIACAIIGYSKDNFAH